MNDPLDDLGSALLALQQADSFFPTGAVAWSWGLETLKADGYLGPIERVPPRRRSGKHVRIAALRCAVLSKVNCVTAGTVLTGRFWSPPGSRPTIWNI